MELIIGLIIGTGFVVIFSIIAYFYLMRSIDKSAKNRKKREKAFFKELENLRRFKNKLKAYGPSKNNNPE